MLTALPESFYRCREELALLFPVHWEKLAMDLDAVPLDPDYSTYLELENKGQLMLVTLRDTGRMVGYWCATVAPALHYQSTLTASLDMWNVLAEYETSVATMILMRAVEREYARRGVKRSFVGEKIHKPCGRLYKLFGYEPVELHYSKMLEN